LVEVLSRLVKEQVTTAEATPADSSDAVAVLEEHVKKVRALDKAPANEEGKALEVPCAVPDFNEEAEMFASAGVGLGQAESYKVMCSLRNMAAKLEGYEKVRFWGKIFGTQADYYVAEALGGDGEAPEGEEEIDPPGSGVNQFTYFVASDLAGDWVKLPHIKPSEIVAARKIKRMFTGNPKAKVITHPYFSGLEEVLLRAQIARISADTVLCPKGMYEVEDDMTKISPDPPEDFKFPAASELVSTKAWMHMVPHILSNGRTAHKELPDQDENPQEYAAMKEEQEADPPKSVIRSLDEDGLQWVAKQAGDRALYASPLPNTPPRSNAVTYVRCLAWPGAVCVAQRTTFSNVYIGYGQRAGEPDFFPPAPPDIQDEPEDPGEVPEPQGTEEEAEAPTEE